MPGDPRKVLDEAARRRLPCELLSREGTWRQGRLVRVDRAGVVLVVGEPVFHEGEDLRVWLAMDGRSITFEASVLRAGVPVPDRSQHGLMLGFIDSWSDGAEPPEAGERERAPGVELTVLPPRGRGLDLLGGDCLLVELTVRELAFAVPREIALKFVEGGTLRVRFRVPGRPDHVVQGTVRRLAPGEGRYLYGLSFDEVPDAAAHLEAVEAVRRAI